jgi:3-deoxy-D-manno-octulosonic acid kinase
MGGMSIERTGLPQGATLHDPSFGIDPSVLFDREALLRCGALTDAPGGRGSISFIQLGDSQLVLRRYLRGGLVARVSKDRYLWLGEDRTRAFREFRLLAELLDRGLPVPRPVAARYLRGRLGYRGELVTERLPDTASLAERWLAGETGDADWQLAGRCIRRFHDAGVQHADLNANNIMLDRRGGVWLLDFDRGRLRAPGPWRERVLARLARSLEKIGTAAGRGDEWAGRYALLKAAHDAPPC